MRRGLAIFAFAIVGCQGHIETNASPLEAGVDGGVVARFDGVADDEDAACHGVVIRASDYDQSCATDSDCVAVSEGSTCFECLFSCAGLGAINRNALASYHADLANSGFHFTGAECQCPAHGGSACCRSGRCAGDVCCRSACPTRVPR